MSHDVGCTTALSSLPLLHPAQTPTSTSNRTVVRQR